MPFSITILVLVSYSESAYFNSQLSQFQMLLVLLFSLFSVGFGMRVMRRELLKDQPTVLLLGPLEVLTSSSSEDDTPDFPSLRDKRGVDPMSIPRLIKEPPLKKRSGDFKRGDVVYPSAAKQTVPLVRVREPPLKRGQSEFFCC